MHPFKRLKYEIKSPSHLDSADADSALKQLLDGTREEERDGEAHGAVERHRHEHAAGGDGVPQEDVEGEGDKEDDLAGAEEGGHVEASQVGALQDHGDLLPERAQRIPTITDGEEGCT